MPYILYPKGSSTVGINSRKRRINTLIKIEFDLNSFKIKWKKIKWKKIKVLVILEYYH
jgi:hypothetical protein